MEDFDEKSEFEVVNPDLKDRVVETVASADPLMASDYLHSSKRSKLRKIILSPFEQKKKLLDYMGDEVAKF